MTRNYECHLSNCKHVNSKRTADQNSAMHLWFQLVADELNAAGYSRQHVLSKTVDLDWDMSSVKEDLWRSVQKPLLGKNSTTELKKTEDITRVFEHLNRFLGEKLGIHVPFPFDPNKHEEKQYITSHEKINYPTKFEEPTI